MALSRLLSNAIRKQMGKLDLDDLTEKDIGQRVVERAERERGDVDVEDSVVQDIISEESEKAIVRRKKPLTEKQKARQVTFHGSRPTMAEDLNDYYISVDDLSSAEFDKSDFGLANATRRDAGPRSTNPDERFKSRKQREEEGDVAGIHAELKLSTPSTSVSRDPNISSNIFSNFDPETNEPDYSSIYVFKPKDPKNLPRDLTANEYDTLVRQNTEMVRLDPTLEDSLVRSGRGLKLPAGREMEAEEVIFDPENYEITRLVDNPDLLEKAKQASIEHNAIINGVKDSEGEERLRFLEEQAPEFIAEFENLNIFERTGGLEELKLAERYGDIYATLFSARGNGGRYVNLFNQLQDPDNPVNLSVLKQEAFEYYSEFANLMKRLQGLGRFTSGFGARGTYDKILKRTLIGFEEGNETESIIPALQVVRDNLVDNQGELTQRGKKLDEVVNLFNEIYEMETLPIAMQNASDYNTTYVALKNSLFNLTEQLAEGGNVDSGFAEGGLQDEGGTVDPVSGNDVPSGSTQAEVRDDIPAQLSEGEFVFPADVVRYIGLENLMSLRQKAKAGLAKMEAMGQMGNSEEAIISDNIDFKSEIGNMIKDRSEPVEMQTGGDITPSGTPTYLNQQTPDYLKPSSVYTAPKFAGQQQQSTQTVYQPDQFVTMPASSQFTSAPIGQPATDTRDVATQPLPYQMKKFESSISGAIAFIPFINGEPMFPVPEGYVEVSRDPTKQNQKEKVETTKVETTKVAPTGGDGDDDPKQSKPQGSAVIGIAKGLNKLFPKSELTESIKDYDNTRNKGILSGVLSLVAGSPVGLGYGMYKSNNNMNKIQDEIKQNFKRTQENNPDFIAVIDALPKTTGISTSAIENNFVNAVNYGLDPALAAALSVTPEGFKEPLIATDIDGAGQETSRLLERGTGTAEQAVRNAFSAETLGPEAFRTLVENAAYYDATGRGIMGYDSSVEDLFRRTSEADAVGFDKEGYLITRSDQKASLQQPGIKVDFVAPQEEQEQTSSAFNRSALARSKGKDASNIYNKAIRNINTSKANRGEDTTTSPKITNVTRKGDINVDTTGDGKADRAIDKDANSRNYNIDREDDFGVRGSEDDPTGFSFAKGGLGVRKNKKTKTKVKSMKRGGLASKK